MTVLLLLALGCGGLGSAPAAYTGTIEVTEIEVSSAMPGRLIDVAFDEGDRVAPGDLVFTLDATAVEAEVDLRVAGVAAAQAMVDAATEQAHAAEEQVAYLRREVARIRKMEEAGVGTPQQRSSLEGQLAVSRAQAAAATQVIAQAEAARAQAEAGVRVAEKHLAETRVSSVVGGVVLSRNREPGEVVGPGMSVVTVGELARPRLRVYVPLAVVETLSIGDPVQVTVDIRPDEPVAGKVFKIASQAEFTPRDILTPEERVKRVFAVDISLDPGPGMLPGVPAEADFSG